MALHVARVLACDAEPAGQSGPGNAATGHASKPGARPWRDGTAYLAPQLAFNLGLPYHLAPFLHAPSHNRDGEPAARGSGVVVVEPLQALPATPASGCAGGGARERRPWGGAPQPGTASAVTVACLMEPDASLLRRGGSVSGDGDAAKGPDDPEPGPAEGERAGARSPGAGPTSDNGGESIVAALRRHFLFTPRREPGMSWITMRFMCAGASFRCAAWICQCARADACASVFRLLAEGDTFAAAVEDVTGRSDLLRALHCPGEAAAPANAGTGYFKVVDMKPQTGISLLIDCKHTAVMLEVRDASLASPPF